MKHLSERRQNFRVPRCSVRTAPACLAIVRTTEAAAVSLEHPLSLTMHQRSANVSTVEHLSFLGLVALTLKGA